MSERGIHGNIGLPGTGLSYRTRLDTQAPASDRRGVLVSLGAALLSLMERARDFFGGQPISARAEHTQQVASSAPAPTRTHSFTPRSARLVNFTAREAATEYENYVRDLHFEPRQEAVFRAVTLLMARERGEPLWKRWADLPLQPVKDEDSADPEELEAYARQLAMQRFARRMKTGDRAAWAEVLQTELSNEELPFGFAFDFAVEDETDRIRLDVKLPDEDLLDADAQELGWGKLKLREAYEDVCCGLALRIANEVYRVIPEADDVVLTGYIPVDDPATGQPARAVLLKFATDRESFAAISLDAVDPSTALAHLGGASKKKRGALVPLGYEPLSESLPDTAQTSDPDVIEGTGSVVRVELEGGFFAIRGDDGKTYNPTNLAQEFRQHGLRVRYQLRPRHDMLGTHQVATTVDVIRIERI